MNQRIKELEAKCWEGDSGACEENVKMVFNTKKFAELLIRECARFADNSPQYVAGREILEHFGVEE